MFIKQQKPDFITEVQTLEKKIDQIRSVEELRYYLQRKGLKFVVVILSKDSTCVEWNITEKQVCKVLDLGLRIRISRISDESESLETVHSEPIHVKEENWVDLDDLFEILKKGIAICIKKATITKKKTTNGNK